ncbi:hypothetical protein RB595_003679 [Gaeumannomyces hyphopodioides]
MDDGETRPLPVPPASRRHAVNACEVCRQRKVKCDEGRPKCSRCSRLLISCVYVQSSTRSNLPGDPDPHLLDIVGALRRVEAKLDQALERRPRSRSPARLPQNAVPGWIMDQAEAAGPETPSYYVASNAPEFLALPFRHITAPENMLLWPYVQRLLPGLRAASPLELELARYPEMEEMPEFVGPGEFGIALVLDSVQRSDFHHLIRLYFEEFHPQFPILNKAEFESGVLTRVHSGGFVNAVDSCLALLVLSLGCVADRYGGDERWRPGSSDSTASPSNSRSDHIPGSSFYRAARRMVQNLSGVSWQLTQCLLLAGIYESCRMRAYEHWNLVHRAAMNIIILLEGQPQPTPLQSRIYWVTYQQESQILAEMKLPPSGIGRLESDVPLPIVEEGGNSEDLTLQFLFLAQISLRRLLNRIHAHMYSPSFLNGAYTDGPGDDSSAAITQQPPQTYTGGSVIHQGHLTIISELDRQLEVWRTHLPEILRFDNNESLDVTVTQCEPRPGGRQRPIGDRLLGFLRARYLAAKSIIHRPFLHAVLHAKGIDSVAEGDVQKAALCLRAAFAGPIHAGILGDPFPLMQLPLNPCRTALLLKLASRHWLRPYLGIPTAGYNAIIRTQDRVEREAAQMSPIVAADMAILRQLDSIEE